MNADDPLVRVFLSNAKKEVFHSVEHRHQIWRENPFDVEQVHEHARAQFQRLLAQATTPPGLESGRILLLLGESGSGKTHLVRSFRNYVHCNGLGFVGYMQMTTTLSYGRYLVSNLIDSLDQPYYESVGTTSGLLRLSNAVAARCGDPQAVEALAENAELSDEAVADLVDRAADHFIAQPRYADLDLDLVRALLFLQRQTPRLKQRVVKYLRCEELAERDQRLLGGMSPRRGEEDGQRLVEQLGRLMGTFNTQSLVLCVDQFEDAYQNDDAAALFRRAITALCSVADRVPSSIIVVSCLEDYYDELRKRLTVSMIDRIERDPPPARLKGGRSAAEAEMIIRQRLGYLYETSGVKPPEGDVDPIYPIPRELVRRVTGVRVRTVLDEARQFRDACAEAGRIVELPPLPSPSTPSPPPDDGERRSKALQERIEQDWNDYLAQAIDEPPESDDKLAELFGWAIQTCADELESRHRFEVRVDGRLIEVGVLVPEADGRHRLREEILVAICNQAPQGNGLRLQIEAALQRAQHRVLALVRCGEFPRNPRTQVAKAIAEVISKGGRKAVVEDSDWRKIAAFQSFRAANERRDHFIPWLMEENHLSRLLPLIHTLDLDGLDRFDQGAPPRPASVAPAAPELRRSTFDVPPTPAPASLTPVRDGLRAPGGAAPLSLGYTGELIAQELTLAPEALTSHAAFLGSTGSGKTTLALHVIEQLLLRGIPAILIDRKGDLCAYAREAIWSQRQDDPAREARRHALRERLDLALFTPGHREGRQLSLSLMPRGLSALTDLDREQAAGYSAQALGDMLGYKHTRKDKALRAILVQAFQLFAAHGNADRLDLPALIEFIANEDPALVAALGRLDTRHFKVLVDDLSTLKLGASDLLSGGEPLDPDLLFGLGAHARKDRTRLSIISTRFLGDSARVLFWVSQLLLALTRWISRAPSPHLTAVVLFDEADLYLPAQSQPATKAPMENLLRRARSGGLGLVLATQSPGDLDYKCRDNIRSWFVGRVTQAVALEKMKPLLSEARVNVGARIPGQKVGEFHLLQDGRATPFRGDRSILQTEQVPEHEILKLAAWHRRAPGR